MLVDALFATGNRKSSAVPGQHGYTVVAVAVD